MTPACRELAVLTGWHFTKVSKLENDRQHPSDHDIHAWCTHCHAPGEISGLIATAHSVESMYIEWRQQMKFGLKRPQQARTPAYERTRPVPHLTRPPRRPIDAM